MVMRIRGHLGHAPGPPLKVTVTTKHIMSDAANLLETTYCNVYVPTETAGTVATCSCKDLLPDFAKTLPGVKARIFG